MVKNMNETKAKTKSRFNMRRIIVTSLIVILSLSGAFMAFRGNLTPSTTKDPIVPTRGGMPMVGIAFAAPPFDLEDPSFGVPINVSNIGLFCYYYESTGWNLSLTYTAFQNYTDWSTYVDGYVRVWQDATGGTYTGSDDYVDVSVRVRGDGWIMGWLNQNQNKGEYIYYAASRSGSSTPPANATSMARAMQRVYAAAAKTFPTAGYGVFSYYDYQYTTATRLVIFGNMVGPSIPAQWYGWMTLRSSVNYVHGWLEYQGLGGYVYTLTILFDGNTIVSYTTPASIFGRFAVDLATWTALFTTNAKHQWSESLNNPSYAAYCGAVIMLWLN
jgi:hypothetical protein